MVLELGELSFLHLCGKLPVSSTDSTLLRDMTVCVCFTKLGNGVAIGTNWRFCWQPSPRERNERTVDPALHCAPKVAEDRDAGKLV